MHPHVAQPSPQGQAPADYGVSLKDALETGCRQALEELSGRCDIDLHDISPGSPPFSCVAPVLLHAAGSQLPGCPCPCPCSARQGGDAAASVLSSPAWRSRGFGLCSGRAQDVCLVSLVITLPAPIFTFSFCRLGQVQQKGNVEWLRSNTSLGTAGATSHSPSVPLGSLLFWVPSPKGSYQEQRCSNKLLQQQPKGSHPSLPCAGDTGTGSELREELQE